MFKIEKGNDNQILRKISEKIRPDEFKKYIELGKKMVKYVKDVDNNGGVGLAAPQIGINKRLIAVSLLKTWDDEAYPTILMINPVVLEFSSECDIMDEGCLSLPGKSGEVERSLKIKIEFINQNGLLECRILSGISSRVVLHEIDHLDGILFMDRVK